ncbi:myeloid differentiation primary response protein MyD88 [Sabethes cyaneus]|uniref:myeloid differentiation primary response protein MyD88 n=1 Tax=Sabethes cyaneus TaxID=53552 RepID=UPI00237EBCBC|nr:myeloid differentiation primary response protein MyD88 [Sabethes cyaneus]
MVYPAVQNCADNADPYNVDLGEVPLSALRQPSYQLLSALLNRKKIFKSEEGYWRDWRGMFQVIGFENHYISELENNSNPTKRVLHLWEEISESLKYSANLKELQNVLGVIDRWDVVDSSNKYIVDDAVRFITEQQKKTNKILEGKINQENIINNCLGLDEDIITVDDTRGKKQIYDAFVLFADADVEFATKMVERLEERRLKVCVKDRDLLAGISFEHEAIIRLISERCRRLVIVISKEFLSSPLNEFFVTFAQALQIEQKKRKIIPCVYKRMVLPPNLQFYFILDYERSNKLYNFWDKLEGAIKTKQESSPTEFREATKSVELAILPSASRDNIQEPKPSLDTESIPERQKKEVAPTISPRALDSRESAKRFYSSWDIAKSSSNTLKTSSSLELATKTEAVLPKEKKKRKWYSKFGLTSSESRTTMDEGLNDSQRKNKTKWYKSSKKIATAL